MARPPRNGIGGQNMKRRSAGQLALTEYHRAPLGKPPADFNAKEKKMFNDILAECPYLDSRAYRRALILTARVGVRYDVLVRFFKRRAAELEKENPGEGEALAYMATDGSNRRHALAIELKSSEDSMRASFTALGMSMASQARILQSIGTKEAAEKSELAAKYFT